MSNPRLPIPGSDDGAWGDLLNEYLRVAHTEDGSLKNGVVKAPQLGLGSVTAPALGSGVVGTGALADGSVVEDKLSAETKNKLDAVDSKADSVHIHEIGDVNELQVKLNALQGALNELQGELDEKADGISVVKLTDNQTVSGIKTFSSSPIVPDATESEQAVNKGQIDAALNNKATLQNIPDQSVPYRNAPGSGEPSTSLAVATSVHQTVFQLGTLVVQYKQLTLLITIMLLQNFMLTIHSAVKLQLTM